MQIPSDALCIGEAEGNPHPYAVTWQRPRWDGLTDIHAFCHACGQHWQKPCHDPRRRGPLYLLDFGRQHGHR
jgi:hypothetical protein